MSEATIQVLTDLHEEQILVKVSDLITFTYTKDEARELSEKLRVAVITLDRQP